MNRWQSIFLWISLAGAPVLSALSNLSYQPFDIEYVAALLGAALLGTACHTVSRYRIARILLLLGFSALPPMLGFAQTILYHPGLLAGFAMLYTGLAWMAVIRFRHALLLTGIVAFSQIITAIAGTPSLIRHETTAAVTRRDIPSVVHLLLDEHGGIAAFPDSVSKADIKILTDTYVNNGFLVFTHAYTKEHDTPYTVNRMFNIHSPVPPPMRSVERQDLGPNQWTLSRSDTFDDVGRTRALDITSILYIDVVNTLSRNPATARVRIYNENQVHGIIQHYHIPAVERLKIATYKILSWYYSVESSKALKLLYRQFESSAWLTQAQYRLSRTHPLTSNYMLEQLDSELSTSGQRGTYYYLHLILPHYPYVYDRDCHVKPNAAWYAIGANQRGPLYDAHMQQALCAATGVSKLMTTINASPALHDATIFLHGDHGTRIPNAPDEKQKEKDQYGTFVAIRIPGVPGRLVDTPVRLDLLYKQLLDNDFKSLNLKNLPPPEGSIY